MIRRSDSSRNASMLALNTERGANTQIQVRTGANTGTGGQGTLLAQLTGNSGGWGSAVNGVLTASAVTADTSADATGIAGHYQLNTQAAVFIESGLLDGSDGGTIDDPNIEIGQNVQLGAPWVNIAAYDDGV